MILPYKGCNGIVRCHIPHPVPGGNHKVNLITHPVSLGNMYTPAAIDLAGKQIVQIYLVQCFLPIPSGELMTKDGVMESIRPVTMAPPLPRHQPFSSRTSRTTLSISGVTLIIRWRLDTLTTASSKSISSRPVMASRIRT